MKKSKFLKSSKDLLSRSFNSSKCKTALKLAGSRAKLLRNKKEVQVKQMKREIAQLLESGQNQTARIRIEHVVREEKMMAAFDLIEIYCELTVARMQIIETQKLCPGDLKEAIASLIFASPRCGDVPELGDVKKQFTEKYGKDFASAAVELRPESGVSRLLVEKLSTTAPDGQTKIKILSAIAAEHNIKWDPESFGEKESVPPTDLLKGSRTFDSTKFHVEPLRAENLDAQASQTNHRMQNHSLSNLSQPDYRSSAGTEHLTSARTSSVNQTFHHEESSPALHEERAQLFPRDGSATSRDRRTWNMEFKDATAAAQAAAESAELASMAARAAAELSSRDKFMRQYSNESYKSDSPVSERGRPETYVNSKMAREQSFEEPRNSRSSMKEFSQSTSFKSTASIHEDNSLHRDTPDAYRYSLKKSFPEASRDEIRMQRQSFKAHSKPEKHDNVGESMIGKQHNSHSRSGILGMDSFPSSRNEGIYRETSHEPAGLVYDKSDSDGDIGDFSTGPKYDDHEPGVHFPASRQRPPNHFSVNPDSWSPRSNSCIQKSASSLNPTRKNYSDHSENFEPAGGSKLDDSVSVKFDESDGSSSESDLDISMSRHTRIDDSRDANSPAEYVLRKSSSDHPATLVPRNSRMESNHTGKSSSDNGMALDLGKLTGGLRHKGFKPPPFSKNQNDTPSRPTVSASSENPGISTAHKHSISEKFQNSHSLPNCESSVEEESLTKRSSGQTPREYTPRAGNGSNTKPNLAPSKSFFDSDSTDSDEDAPKESFARISQKQNGISQKSKVLSSGLGKISYSKTRPFDDQMDQKRRTTTPKTPKIYESWKSSTQMDNHKHQVGLEPVKPNSYTSGEAASQLGPEARRQYTSLRKNSNHLGNSEQPSSAKAAPKPPDSNMWGTPTRHNSGKANPSTVQESNPSAGEELPKTEASNHVKTPNKTNSNNQRASHVHPKLPDYDTLVQALRKHRS